MKRYEKEVAARSADRSFQSIFTLKMFMEPEY